MTNTEIIQHLQEARPPANAKTEEKKQFYKAINEAVELFLYLDKKDEK